MRSFVINLLCCIAILALNSNCKKVHFILTMKTTAYFQCMKSSGINKIALLSPSLYYEDDQNQELIQNMRKALNAGLRLEVGLYPQRSKPIQVQVDFLSRNLELDYVDRVWFAVSDASDELWGNHTVQQNCRYMRDLLTLMRYMKIQGGIAASIESWTTVFKSQTTVCPEISQFPLWWVQEEDTSPNFDSYTQIGGWKTPYMKLYNQEQVCGKWIWTSYLP